MDVLWEKPESELTVRDVADILPDYAYTTVATVLDRLVHKGLVHRRMDRRTIRFTTIGTRGTHTAVLMHEALSVDPDADAALVRFAETLSPSEATVLYGALKGLERKARKTDR
jgi:predicted transcriptional regulator